MRVETNQIRGYRLWAHHLDRKLAMDDMLAAAGACGLQNTPPGAWETALFNRLKGCTKQALNRALYEDKVLLQAWSYRGVPAVFPTEQSDIFLTPLIAQPEEQPWIYTTGIAGALDYLEMTFDDLLERLKKAIVYLDSHTLTSKETLDKTLADNIWADLPEEKRSLWRGPSMYGNPSRQTVGAAAVSFLLRPCSFSSLVVFGERRKNSPEFTSFKNWTGREPRRIPDAAKELTRKFLRCYGPATVECFMGWLGCSPKQARRLWDQIGDETLPVQVGGKTCSMLSADVGRLLSAEADEEKLTLLGAHDPYLDLRDRAVILEEEKYRKIVWQYVANPGAVLKGGRVIGIWKAKTLKSKLEISITAWEPLAGAERQTLRRLAQEYAGFRLLPLQSCTVENI